MWPKLGEISFIEFLRYGAHKVFETHKFTHTLSNGRTHPKTENLQHRRFPVPKTEKDLSFCGKQITILDTKKLERIRLVTTSSILQALEDRPITIHKQKLRCFEQVVVFILLQFTENRVSGFYYYAPDPQTETLLLEHKKVVTDPMPQNAEPRTQNSRFAQFYTLLSSV